MALVSNSLKPYSMEMSDPRLPMIATQAAIEFDNAVQGKHVEFKSAKRLADFLRTSFEKPVDAVPVTMNLDATAVDLVGMALNQSSWTGGITTIADVVKKAWDVADNIDEAHSATAQAPLIQLRAFCVALGNNLISYRESIQSYRPSSPYRR